MAHWTSPSVHGVDNLHLCSVVLMPPSSHGDESFDLGKLKLGGRGFDGKDRVIELSFFGDAGTLQPALEDMCRTFLLAHGYRVVEKL